MAIQTNQVSYTDGSTTIRTSFVLTWIEEQNQAGNYTDLTLIVTTSQTPTGSGWKRTLKPSGTYAIVNGVETNLISADKSVYNGLEVKRFTQRIEHEADGTKAINASLRINVNGSICTGSGTITLTPINRINQMSVTPATLTNQDATITITKYVSSYTTTIEYTIAGGTYTLADKASGTSFTLAYDDLKALIGVFTSDDIYIKATTYDGANAIGYVDTTITIQTGQIAFSLYDDREGNVGATFGEEATEDGVNVYVDTKFGKPSKPIEMNFANAFSVGKFETLWSQSAPSTQGATTINVDLSKYEAVIIVTSTGGYFNYAFTTRINGEWQGATHRTKVTEQQGGRMVARYFGVYNDHIEVGAGYRFNTYGNSGSTTDNAMVIPVAIIGVH